MDNVEPIKLVKIITEEVEDDCGIDDLVTKYEYKYEYDENDNEKIVGLTIIDSCQYTQENADEDWKQVLEWIKEDEERINSYGASWYNIGVRAKAILHFPMRNTLDSIIQRISSPGIFGIESDYDNEFIKSEECNEISILLDMLECMHVKVSDNFKCDLTLSDTTITVGEIRDTYKK